jgi:hypothetical protein
MHHTVATADLLSATDALVMVFAPQSIQLTAPVICRAESHHQFLFVERGFQNVGTHLNHRYLYQVGLLKGRIRINIDLNQTVRIFRL